MIDYRCTMSKQSVLAALPCLAVVASFPEMRATMTK